MSVRRSVYFPSNKEPIITALDEVRFRLEERGMRISENALILKILETFVDYIQRSETDDTLLRREFLGIASGAQAGENQE